MSHNRVLLADSDEQSLARYRAYLAKEGFIVCAARTGLECMERLIEQTPDVLVLNPALMAGFGAGTLSTLADGDDGPAVQVIVLAEPDCDLPANLAEVSVGAWLIKPLSPLALTQQVRRMLDQPSQTERFVTEWA
jgi:DNA-binding response OmpR family regulator